MLYSLAELVDKKLFMHYLCWSFSKIYQSQNDNEKNFYFRYVKRFCSSSSKVWYIGYVAYFLLIALH